MKKYAQFSKVCENMIMCMQKYPKVCINVQKHVNVERIIQRLKKYAHFVKECQTGHRYAQYLSPPSFF